MSDTEHDGLSYTTQPHVVLDAILATLSLGPVGISDGLGQVDAGLISQAFRARNDSTLLRPSRPLSWVDGFLLNKTWGRPAVDVRSTHAAVPRVAGGGGAGAAPNTHSALNTHSVLAWSTTQDATLGASDLFPPPAAGATLAVRAHILSPPGAAQAAGCVAGAPAVPACVALVAPGSPLVVPATGGNLSDLGLWSVHEPLGNGAFFLGELTKFVHVSPQRFAYVALGGAAPAGLLAGVRGAPGEAVELFAVDASGVVRVAVANVPAGGSVEVAL